MFSDFKIIDPLFEDQVHERHQFSLVIEEQEYTGIVENNEITWYHPQPDTILNEHNVKEIEEEVLKLIRQELQ